MQKVHFIAIGGQGMSGVAGILLKKGYQVTGSDLKVSENTERLRSLGATVYTGHRAENLGEPDVVVVSSAIHDDNPELILAREKEIPVLHRMDMLLRAIDGHKTVAVAGSHGKTTTSSMISWVLLEDEKDPTFLLGGELNRLENWRLGQGVFAVVETDESDGSFLKAHPDVALVTNIDNDHLDYWKSMEALESAFYRFLDGCDKGERIVCADDPRLKKWAEGNPHAVTYSVNGDGTWRAEGIVEEGWRISCSVVCQGQEAAYLTLSHPGIHNLQNALGALVAASFCGVPPERAALHLASYPGTKRRLQLVGVFGGVTVIDDFAHHPSEMTTCIRAVRHALPGRRLVVLFQPHRYSRTALLKDEFTRALSGADVAVVTGIYAGPGEDVRQDTVPGFVQYGPGTPGRKNMHYVPSPQEAAAFAACLAESGDVLMTMGAGDIWQTHQEIAELLGKRAE